MEINEKCRLLTDHKVWMEQDGIHQLIGICKLQGVKRAVGMPDLHPGKSPVGIGVLTEGRLYPHLIGNDIGCGMALFETGIKCKKFKQSRMAGKLESIHELSDIPVDNPYLEESPISDLGTIGSGNHFAEYQCVHEILDQESAEKYGIGKEQVYLCIHSGSRGYGQQILNRFFDADGLMEDSKRAEEYLREHENALLWAKRNRLLTAEKLNRFLGFSKSPRLVLDCCHNYIERYGDGWMHRKGAVSSRQELVIIPGSRGSLTYVCRPLEDKEEYLSCLSHGAGRKWARSICKSRINKKYDRDSIRTTSFKSSVVCHDTNLLFQEAPEAYKNIEDIMRILKQEKLIEMVAALRPLITYKG